MRPPRRGGPDAGGVLLQAVVAERLDACAGELAQGGLEVVDHPAEHGVGPRVHALHRGHAQHGAVGVEHAREGVALDQREAEDVAVEGAGAVGVGRGGEGDDVAGGDHAPTVSRAARAASSTSASTCARGSRKRPST